MKYLGCRYRLPKLFPQVAGLFYRSPTGIRHRVKPLAPSAPHRLRTTHRGMDKSFFLQTNQRRMQRPAADTPADAVFDFLLNGHAVGIVLQDEDDHQNDFLKFSEVAAFHGVRFCEKM